ncbi:type II secretion system protein [Sulfurovum sp. bin170]|uniref:type II secretion system protein n=1 Tax=Sulfurovum sp. bin170 TaxID=2695268 RepID=UPI0013E00AAF|nr:type II secretion system protein [Sulfurovum sp. bin170]NEW60101.1 type II secretion system protein [Sulfurovum sp. bin170]
MINPKQKKAFSMVTAIFVIFVMSSVTMLIMNITGKTVKATTHQYQKEQAQLLARSYTELAILYVIHYDRTATPDCLQTITDHFGGAGANGYDIRINIQYIGNSTLLNGCGTTIAPWAATDVGFNSSISIVIDTFVTYKDFDDPSALVANGDRNITFHRRTLQKL